MNRWNSKREFLISISLESITKHGNANILSNNLPIVTDEIFIFLKRYKINLSLEDLIFFCITDNVVKSYKANIKRCDNKDFNDLLIRLKNTADRIQFYSLIPITITLPKFPLKPSNLIWLLYNRLKKGNNDKKIINKILSFFKYKNKPTISTDDRNIIEKYFHTEQYITNIDKSHVNIVKNYSLTDTKIDDKKEKIILDDFIKLIEKDMQTILYNVGSENSKYDKEFVHYIDINTNNDVLNDVKKMLTYDIYEHIIYDKTRKIHLDLFTLWRFISCVNNHKFLLKSDLSSYDGRNFRDMIKKLKKDANTIYYFSRNEINIQLPMYKNLNQWLMVYHLKERGVDNNTIDYLLEIFYDRTRKPSIDKYINKKNKTLNLLQEYLKEKYNKDKYYMDTLPNDKDFLKLFNKFETTYQANVNFKNTHKLIKIDQYAREIKNLLEKYEELNYK